MRGLGKNPCLILKLNRRGEPGESVGGARPLGDRQRLAEVLPHKALIGDSQRVVLLDDQEGQAGREHRQQHVHRQAERRDLGVALGPEFHPGRRADGSGVDRLAVEQVLEVVGQCLGGLIPPRGVFLETFQADRFQVLRDRRVEAFGRSGVLVADLAKRHEIARRAERGTPRDQLIKRRADVVHIAGHADLGIATRLLRRHVTRSAQRSGGHRQVRRVIEQLDQAEVGDQRLVVLVDQDIAGLDVAVQERKEVRLVDGPGDLFKVASGGEFLDRPLDEPVRQALSLDVLHRVERPAVELADVVDGDDVGVLEPGGGGRFVAKPFDRLDIQPRQRAADDIRADQFQRDDPLGVVLQGAKHNSHAAAADAGEEFVAPHPAERFLPRGTRIVEFKIGVGGRRKRLSQPLKHGHYHVQVIGKSLLVFRRAGNLAAREPQFDFEFQKFLQEERPVGIRHRANPRLDHRPIAGLPGRLEFVASFDDLAKPGQASGLIVEEFRGLHAGFKHRRSSKVLHHGTTHGPRGIASRRSLTFDRSNTFESISVCSRPFSGTSRA